MRTPPPYLAALLLLCHVIGQGQAHEWGETSAVRVVLTDELVWANEVDGGIDDSVDHWMRPASLWQPTPFLTPRLQLQPEVPAPDAAGELDTLLFSRSGLDRSSLRQARLSGRGLGWDLLLGTEAAPRSTTDLGNLIRKTPSATSTQTQRRTPIVNDPRVRGSRIGSLAGNGSYWVPARIDLDTMLSKIDSRVIEDVVIVPGPYTSTLGPAFNFVDFQFTRSPRFVDGATSSGTTSTDFNTNGEQWYGRQEVVVGNTHWGARVSYGHRTGNDYESGGGARIPASYNSRDWLVTIGKDLTHNSSIEFNYLRLDQTDVEFPGYAFDLDFLVTDGFEVQYTLSDQSHFDYFELDAWYNRTRFEGNAQNPSKRLQFPVLNNLDYSGRTDVDSTSTGFKAATTWGQTEFASLTVGVDLRLVNQELNEIASGVPLGGGVPFLDRNSPIPDSTSVNPGLFIQHVQPLNEQFHLRAGARADYTHTDNNDDTIAAALVGLGNPQATYAEVVGTDDYDRNFGLWSAYVVCEYEINDCWTAGLSTGYCEQPPNLTELYAAEPFMFLLQNGLNTVTGDPRLKEERKAQLDITVAYEDGPIRAGARGFYAWIRDYITFENIGDVMFQGQVAQVNLRYVNTNLATLAGGELFGEVELSTLLTSFATLKYVEGRDHARNGGSEPLPSIAPLEGNVGVRLHQDSEDPVWGVEVLARLVAAQRQVADSLLETETPGFVVVDMRGYWQQTNNLQWIAGIENIGNRNYREHLDFRGQNSLSVFQPGFNLYWGAELTY